MDDTAVFNDVPSQSENSKGKLRAVDDQNTMATSEIDVASNQGPTLGASVSSLFSKLTSDPRIVQLQHSLTTTLQSVSSPQGSAKEGEGAEKAAGSTPINLQESLSKLSLTIQSHLPHLDLKESQQLATRYLNATESFAREMQSDMKDFVGELVRIVPPEGEENKAEAPITAASEPDAKVADAAEKTTPVEGKKDTSNKTVSSSAVKTTAPAVTAAAAAPAEDEEDFAWDEDDEEAAAATPAAASASATRNEEAPLAAEDTPAATEPKPAKQKDDECEDDSDWE